MRAFPEPLSFNGPDTRPMESAPDAPTVLISITPRDYRTLQAAIDWLYELLPIMESASSFDTRACARTLNHLEEIAYRIEAAHETAREE